MTSPAVSHPLSVVSNTSPISNLTLCGHLWLLPHLYTKITIPQTVADELFASAIVRPAVEEALEQGWLCIHADHDVALLQHRRLLESSLDAGEAAAIVLAIHQKSDLVLMDERLGRSVAQALSLRVVGVVGILLHAKSNGAVAQVQPILERLVHDIGFRLAPALIERACRLAGE